MCLHEQPAAEYALGMSIRRRLLLFLLPVLGALMLLGSLADFMTVTAATRNAYDQALSAAVVAAATSLDIDGDRARLLHSASVDALLGNQGDRRLYSVTDPVGTVVDGDARLHATGTDADTDNPSFGDAVISGRRMRVTSYRTRTGAGTVTTTLAETVGGRERTQRLLLSGKLLADFAQLDITLLLVWIGVHFGLRPLRAVASLAVIGSVRELERFDELATPLEVRPLVSAFNRLLELLQEAANSQRRFIADAAHQLRTPVAGLMAQIELLLREPAAPDLDRRLELLLRGVQQLGHSSNQLLALARAEPFLATPDRFRPVDLKVLVEQLVERNLDRADRARLDLGAEAHDATVSGDARLLEDVLGNLLDNAVKYTPAGGHVTVRSGVAAGRPYLEVEDDGPGIPEGERARVRERFYRPAGTNAPGCGLGLAIVDEIARLHRAQFLIESAQGGVGSKMLVRFPATSQDSGRAG
jgi:two-component system sensor histidine kinase TctE